MIKYTLAEIKEALEARCIMAQIFKNKPLIVTNREANKIFKAVGITHAAGQLAMTLAGYEWQPKPRYQWIFKN